MIRHRIDTMRTSQPATTSLTVREWVGWLALVLAVSLPLYQPWVGIAAALIALLWLGGAGLPARLTAARTDRLAVAAVVFVALNLLSLVWSSHRLEGLRELGTTWYFLLIPVLGTALPMTFGRAVIIAFAAATSAAAALSLIIAGEIFRLGSVRAANPSPLVHHIDFSLMLALASLMAAVQLLYRTGTRRWRWAWAACWLLVTAALFVNIGRSGHLAFAVGLLVLVIHWSNGRSARAGIAVGVAAVIVLGSIWMVSPRLRDRVITARQELSAAIAGQNFDSSLGGRVAATEVAIELIARRPVLGTGIGDAMPAFRTRLNEHHREMEFAIAWYPHLHSQYLQTAVELGIVGLLSLGWVFWELFRRRPQRPETGALAVVLGTVYLVGFVAEPFFSKPLTVVLFALLAGLIACDRE
jgi:O-antigen ligase